MRRPGLLVLLFIAVAAVGAPVATHAQQGPSSTPVTTPVNPQPVGSAGSSQATGVQITKDQLTAALLTQSDVPGLTQSGSFDLHVGAADAGVTGVIRVFVQRQPLVEVATELFADTDGSTDFASTGEQTLRIASRTFAGSAGGVNANFQMLGPLGVGQQDSAALWETYIDSASKWIVAYADYFQRGQVTAVVLYVSELDAADPSQLVTYAKLQDSKIVAANL